MSGYAGRPTTTIGSTLGRRAPTVCAERLENSKAVSAELDKPLPWLVITPGEMRRHRLTSPSPSPYSQGLKR